MKIEDISNPVSDGLSIVGVSSYPLDMINKTIKIHALGTEA